MAPRRKRDDDRPRAHLPDELHHGLPTLVRVEDPGVGQLRVHPLRQPHDLRRPCRLLGPRLGISPGARLAGGEVHHGGAIAGPLGLDEGPGAGELRVVPMGCDCQKVYVMHGRGM